MDAATRWPMDVHLLLHYGHLRPNGDVRLLLQGRFNHIYYSLDNGLLDAKIALQQPLLSANTTLLVYDCGTSKRLLLI